MLVIPVFPLPNLVFFPKTLLPLHICEARYKEMLQFALGTGKLIGVILLRPGWEPKYFGNPEAYEIGCLGRIQHVEEVEDQRCNILLLGISKYRILNYQQIEPFGLAEVLLVDDEVVDDQAPEILEAKKQLLEKHSRLVARLPGSESMDLSGLSNLSFEAVVNNLIMSLGLDITVKQKLLEQNQLVERGRALAVQIELLLDGLTFFDRYRHLTAADPSRN
jgi:Lon protease-like protein